jgi:hypothetical protein
VGQITDRVPENFILTAKVVKVVDKEENNFLLIVRSLQGIRPLISSWNLRT